MKIVLLPWSLWPCDLLKFLLCVVIVCLSASLMEMGFFSFWEVVERWLSREIQLIEALDA